jgi:hypothetical protein
LCKQLGAFFEAENAKQLVSGISLMRNEPYAYDLYQRDGLAAATRDDRKNLALKLLRILRNL